MYIKSPMKFRKTTSKTHTAPPSIQRFLASRATQAKSKIQHTKTRMQAIIQVARSYPPRADLSSRSSAVLSVSTRSLVLRPTGVAIRFVGKPARLGVGCSAVGPFSLALMATARATMSAARTPKPTAMKAILVPGGMRAGMASGSDQSGAALGPEEWSVSACRQSASMGITGMDDAAPLCSGGLTPSMVMLRVDDETAGTCSRWEHLGHRPFLPALVSGTDRTAEQTGQANRIIEMYSDVRPGGGDRVGALSINAACDVARKIPRRRA